MKRIVMPRRDTGALAMKLLYVEDHPQFSALVTRTFLAAHEVTIAPTLTAARNALATGRFDVVLLDYDLEDGKGTELAEELRHASVRPLMVAASSHAMGNERLLQAGADAVCSKMEFARIEEILPSLPSKPAT